MANRPRELVLCAGDHERLQRVLLSATVEVRVHQRARVLESKSHGRVDFAASVHAGVSEATVSRIVARYREGGLECALGDRPRSGRPRTVCAEDELWLVALACSKPKDVGGWRELWYPALFCDFVREHAEGAGHPRLASACDGTTGRVLARARLKPFRLRYHCVRTDPDHDARMTVLLATYRQVSDRFDADGNLDHVPKAPDGRTIHFLSYDEKPGIQVVEREAPDLMPDPERAREAAERPEGENARRRAEGKRGRGSSSTYASPARYYEYVRGGTQSPLCAIDLLEGQAFPMVRDSHTSADHVDFLRGLDAAYPDGDVIRIILDNH